MKYRHAAMHMLNQPWAIVPATFETIIEVLRYRAGGGKYTAEEIAERVGAVAKPQQQQVGGSVAVLPLFGVMAQRADMMMEMSGGTSTERFAKQLKTLLDDDTVGAIVLDVDSPGGSVFGVEELATLIFKARGRKPILAVADSLMASAAYWVGSAADQLWVTPGGMAGSVGVIAAHVDISGWEEKEGFKTTLITFGDFKAEGNQFEPLEDEARAEIQRMVNSYGESFVGAVARNRGVSKAKVRADFGQGRLMRAVDAVAAGMADKVGTLDEAIQSVLGKPRRSRSTMAEAEPLVMGYFTDEDGGAHPIHQHANGDTHAHGGTVSPDADSEIPCVVEEAATEPNPEATDERERHRLRMALLGGKK